MARKRKLETNSGAYGRKKPSSSRNIREKTVTERERDFPDAPLKVADNKLFCTSCDTKLANKFSTITAHLKSQKHKNG